MSDGAGRVPARARGGLLADIRVLARAVFDGEVPWYVRLLVVAIVAYIVSPVDLVPDFIPVLGLLDELVLVPLGIRLALRLMPPAVLERYRARMDEEPPRQSGLRRAGVLMVMLAWAAVITVIALWLASAGD